ncbi:MAG: hypothetical protein HYX83_02400 [Chloroflexi bacterium]|nr:hypothetical protein [Chloroflexota bacterium]
MVAPRKDIKMHGVAQGKVDAYRQLMRNLKYPRSRNLRNLLELWVTPAEAEVMVELPAKPEAIAQKLNRDVKTVNEQLEAMFQKGAISERATPEGGRDYVRSDVMEGFSDYAGFLFGARYYDEKTREISDPWARKIIDLWVKVYEEDWYKYEKVDEMLHRKRNMPQMFYFPTLAPAWLALEKSEKLGTEILPEWDGRVFAKKADSEGKGILVRACPCRTRYNRASVKDTCGAPLWTCVPAIEGDNYPYGVQSRLNLTKKFAAEEWLEHMGRCEQEFGMVHAARQGGGYTCTCCNECCNWLTPITRYVAQPSEAVDPGPYRAVVNTDVCEGCTKNCVPRCNFKAIKRVVDGRELVSDDVTGRRDPSSRNVKAAVDLVKCTGCGQCVVGCPVEGAIKLELAEKINAPPPIWAARMTTP